MASQLLAAFLALRFLLFLSDFLQHSNTVSAHSNAKIPSPFEFLKHLEGYKKGDKVKGIEGLKNYLQHFGYLSQSHRNSRFNATNFGPDVDYFDEVTDSAIRAYQHNYNLEVTGILDTKTISKMMMPRCGVPDHNINRTRSGIKMLTNGTAPASSFRESSHYSFFGRDFIWPPSKTQLSYAFPPGTNNYVQQSVSQAFRKWASVSHFTFVGTEDFANADVKISFQVYDHGDGNPFDGPNGMLAHAFAPTDGRLHFDGSETWAAGTIPGAYDICTVALHEIGHILGLYHSSLPEAIMFPIIPAGATKDLSSDDIEGIKALYNEV